MARRVTTIAVSITLVLAILVACAPAATPTPVVITQKQTIEVTKVVEKLVTPTPEPVKPFKVALILPSGIDDQSWCQAMYEAMTRVKEAMGPAMEFTVSEGLYKIVDAGAAVRDYAEKGYDLIIAHGSQYQTLQMDIAKEYPNISFAYGSGFLTAPNVFAYTPRAEQGGYLLGMLAAGMTKTNKIGIVGPVRGGDAVLFNEGFKLGVAAYDPSVTVLETYTGSFTDFVKAREMAVAHMDAGADFLAGTAQQSVAMTQAAAERPGVHTVTVDLPHSSFAPDTALATQAYTWDEVISRMIALHKSGILGGEQLVLDFNNGKLQLVYNPKLENLIPKELKDKIEETKQAIITGKLTITVPK